MTKKMSDHKARASRGSKRRREEVQTMTKEMPQSRSSGFPRQQKNRKRGIINGKGNATITKHGLPEAAKEGGMSNNQWQRKCLNYKARASQSSKGKTDEEQSMTKNAKITMHGPIEAANLGEIINQQ